MSALKAIYAGSFKDRPRFDSGGYVDYASATPNAQYYSTDGSGGYVPDTNSGAPSAADISALTSGAATMPTGGNGFATTGDVGTVMNGGLVPGSENGQGGYTSAPSSGTGAISKILSSLGLGGGNTSNTAALNTIAGLISAAGHYKQNQAGSKLPAMPALPALPAMPGTNTGGYGPMGGYGYQNYAGATGAGTGFAPKTQTQAKPTPSYYTYGSGPEQQFFQQITPAGGPIAPVAQHATGGRVGMATGGAVGFDMGGLVPPNPQMGMGTPGGQNPMSPRPMPRPMPQQPAAAPQRPAMPSTMMQRMQAAKPLGMATGGATQGAPTGALSQSRHITGPGDGTSDSIPARLANGEYVIDAQAVSMLGNGDNSAGAKRLDEFRKSLRQHKGGALAKGKMAPDAKPIHKYMGGQ